MKLSDLKTGEKGVIIKVLGHGGFRRRIIEMGFIKGKTVEVLLNAQRGSCQHDSSTISQHGVVPFMRQLLDEESQNGTYNRGTAKPGNTNQYVCHNQ